MSKYYWYDMVEYDIWGNKRDGFQVNDAWVTERDIVIAEDVVKGTDKALIQALKGLGFIKAGIHASSIEVEGEPEYTLYFNDVRQSAGGMCPAFELRCTRITEDQE